MEEKVYQKRLGWNEADSAISTPRTEKENPNLRHEKIGKVIPLFFATDNNYLPFLSITFSQSHWST